MTEPLKRKPLLIGEANPYGGHPEYALYPSPIGCAGHRLCHLILGMDPDAYLDSFNRTNLCVGSWSLKHARVAAEKLWSQPDAPKFILLGAKVSAAFKTRFVPFTIIDGGTILILPHPSGLCRMWGKPGAYARARGWMAEFCPDLAPLFGKMG